jgi:transcriptional regulator with XRE-family HTH domain
MTVLNDDQMTQVGRRIRELRKRKGLTLLELSERVGLSVSHLSQIENGQVNLNIGNLESIGRALDTPLIRFFVSDNGGEVSVVRRSQRRWFTLGEKAAESPLVTARSSIEIFVIRLEPDSDRVHESVHQGEEFSYIIKGNVRVVLDDDQTFDLEEGDVIYYKSDIPHRWQNNGAGTAEILVANTPATY